MRFFNTTGPVVPEDHYCVPPLDRLDLDAVLTLIRNKRYFVMHAPRQTGKTSTLLALRDLLNGGAEGNYRCVYANVEAGQAGREDTERSMRAILGHLALSARVTLQDEFVDGIWFDILNRFGPDGALTEILSRWAQAAPRPLVLFIDEIDTLVGDTLLSVLRQLRAGYTLRPEAFPQSVVLCGVRDVRDYRIHSSSEQAIVAGGSAFNIKAESLRLGDFSEREARTLLAQHSEETGQAFTEDALDEVWRLTQGQPWLINALGDAACFRNRSGAGPQPVHHGGRRHRGSRATRRAPRDASGSARGQAAGRPGAARDRAVAERGRRAGVLRPRSGLRPGPGLDCARRSAPYRQPGIRRSGAARAHLCDPGGSRRGAGLVRRCRWRPERGEAARRLPDVLSRAFGAPGRAFRVQGGRSATPAAGVPATGGERRRPPRAGVRSGPRAHGPARRLAPGVTDTQVRHRVQGPPQEPGPHDHGRYHPDRELHGSVAAQRPVTS